MNVSQTLAARRKWKNDGRYKPKKGGRAATSMNKSQRLAAAKQRKRVQAGKEGGILGGKA